MTIAEMAKELDISPAAIYKAVRVQRWREADVLYPLWNLAKQADIAESVTTNVITILRLEGVPGLKKMPKRRNYELTEKGRFAHLILTSEDKNIIDAVAASEKIRKKKSPG